MTRPDGVTAPSDLHLTSLTARIVSSFVAANLVELDALTSLIMNVHRTLQGAENDAIAVRKPTALEIEESLSTDGIRSFLDGKTYRMLKRHLNAHRVTPTEYRERFGLSPDYPLVAPASLSRRTGRRTSPD